MAFLIEGQVETWVPAFAFSLCHIILSHPLMLVNSEVGSDSSFTSIPLSKTYLHLILHLFCPWSFLVSLEIKFINLFSRQRCLYDKEIMKKIVIFCVPKIIDVVRPIRNVEHYLALLSLLFPLKCLKCFGVLFFSSIYFWDFLVQYLSLYPVL